MNHDGNTDVKHRQLSRWATSESRSFILHFRYHPSSWCSYSNASLREVTGSVLVCYATLATVCAALRRLSSRIVHIISSVTPRLPVVLSAPNHISLGISQGRVQACRTSLGFPQPWVSRGAHGRATAGSRIAWGSPAPNMLLPRGPEA